MAGFQTHISFSTLLGVGYGGVAAVMYEVPIPTCILAGGLCSVAGMLPDIDSDSGVPLRESTSLAAAVVPIMMFDRFQRLDFSPESTILAGATIYLLIRFGLTALLRKRTVHRGMFHSLPAAGIFGLLAFLLAPGEEVLMRAYLACGVVLGYVSHLMLDEVYSIEWYHGRLRLKQSFGTAMKLLGQKWWSTTLAYLQLAILAYVAMKEPGWMQQHYEEKIKPTIHQASSAVDGLLR